MRLWLLAIAFFSQLFCEYHHASSYPYLSGDTWRFFADFRLVGSETFRPVDVQLGDVIFVEYRALRRFGRDYLPKIKNRFILITPNCEEGTDNPQPGEFSYFLNYPQLAHWFVQNIDREASERVIPLPIGLANQVWPHGQVSVLEETLKQGPQERTSQLYMNFAIHTNPSVRGPCFAYFSPLATQIGSPCSFATYLEDLSRTVFVVSPPGNGQDCHRTWEALLMGCYPIVMKSTLNPLYEDLPVVVVSSWDEVTDEFLKAKEEEFRGSKFCMDKLYAPYWYKKIFQLQQELRQNPTWMERLRQVVR
jgi:hypothetical protein